MITKERLEELIEQKKFIYWKFAKIKPSSWSKYTIMGNTIVKGNLKEIYSLDDLFETKEDFEWHRQFGCITRTERLELPTWECMQPKEDEQDVYYNFYNYNHELMGIRVTKQCIALYKSYRCSDLTSTIDIFDNTKENYTLACRKAKELFLGELE